MSEHQVSCIARHRSPSCSLMYWGFVLVLVFEKQKMPEMLKLTRIFITHLYFIIGIFM